MKGLIVHAVLAVGGLVLAYVVWTGGMGGEGREGQVTVLDCEPEEVSRVGLSGEQFEVELGRRGEGDDAHWWVRHVDRKARGRSPEQEFAASERVDDYLELVAPLRATRRVGQMPADTRKEVRLGDGGDEVTVVCGGDEHTFRAGDNAYGSGDRYLLDPRTETVYLVDANIVRDLQSARIRLMQRQLPAFDWKDVARLTVEVHGEERTLLQRNRQEPTKAQWVDAERPDRRNELYGNWLSRLRRMSVTEYLSPGEEPGRDGEEVTPVATFRFEDADGDTLDRWEMVRAVGDGTVEYYARSGATRGWVRLPASLARQVAQDARPVVGLEAVEEPQPAPPPGQAGGADADAGGESGQGGEAAPGAAAGAEAGSGSGSGAAGGAKPGGSGSGAAGGAEPGGSGSGSAGGAKPGGSGSGSAGGGEAAQP